MNVRRADLPRFARDFLAAQGYRGRKIHVEARRSVAIPSDAGLWSGGTREAFFALTRDGSTHGALLNNASPWRGCGRGETIDIPEDVCVAKHSWFCGNDSGWTFYVAAPVVETIERRERSLIQ